MHAKLNFPALGKAFLIAAAVVAGVAVLCAALDPATLKAWLLYIGASALWVLAIYVSTVNTQLMSPLKRLLFRTLKLAANAGGVAILGGMALLIVACFVVATLMSFPPGRAWLQQTTRQEFIGECVRLHHGSAAQCAAASKCDTAYDGLSEAQCERRLGVWGQYEDELAAGRPLAIHDGARPY